MGFKTGFIEGLKGKNVFNCPDVKVLFLLSFRMVFDPNGSTPESTLRLQV